MNLMSKITRKPCVIWVQDVCIVALRRMEAYNLYIMSVIEYSEI